LAVCTATTHGLDHRKGFESIAWLVAWSLGGSATTGCIIGWPCNIWRWQDRFLTSRGFGRLRVSAICKSFSRSRHSGEPDS
ncbi:hypothetical protein BAE44_0007659, partial [Dichanthelium oligosanthes]